MLERKWAVELCSKVLKAISGKQPKKALPEYVRGALQALIREIECFGPTLGPNNKNWPHFGPLGKDQYHCHLTKSKSGSSSNGKKGVGTCYVTCWKVEDKKIKIVKVYYVGTHENAPY